MRLGQGRRVTRTLALLGLVMAWGGLSAHAGEPFRHFHTIPRETFAKDYRTGGVALAPPIPYGTYAKDYAGCVHGAIGQAHGLIGKICGACKGLGCALCGGNGCTHGNACGNCGGVGNGCGNCGGDGQLGGACGGCGGNGCGFCGNKGFLPGGLGLHGGNGPVGGYGLGRTHGLFSKFGHGNKVGAGLHHHGVTPSAQAVVPSGQTFASGQSVARPCGLCHGAGLLNGTRCGGCGGLGSIQGLLGKLCGGCGGLGLLNGGGKCGSCGGSGLCGGNGNGCDDGAGMGLPGSGLVQHVHNKLGNAKGAAHGVVQSALYKAGIGGVEYFVGPGGPVPITPGYVNYVNPVRSPRDYFAFPPFSEREF